VAQEGLQDRAWTLCGERHGGNSDSGLYVRHMFIFLGMFAVGVKSYFSYLTWMGYAVDRAG
jgi:hypothetical protein